MSISIDCSKMCISHAGDSYNTALSMLEVCLDALDPELGITPNIKDISETMMLALSILKSLKDRIDFNELPGATDKAIDEKGGSHPLI